MKKSILLITISLAAVLLASCYFTPQAEENSSLTLSLGETAVARAAAVGADTARVYLLSDNNALFKFGDEYYSEYIDFIETQKIVVEEIPSGTWDVLLSLGTKNANGDFLTLSYGGSESVFVSPGVSADASVTVVDQPYTVAGNLLGENVSSVVNVDGVIYASSGNKLYSGDTAAAVTLMADQLSSAYIINSVSLGKFFSDSEDTFIPELWVNTDKGIVPYQSGEFFTDFHDNGVSVLKSGAIESVTEDESWTADDKLVVFYQRNKGLGGVSIGWEEGLEEKHASTEWSWNDLSELEDTITGELVLDFAVHGDNGYFATTLGAVVLDKNTVEGSGDDWFSQGTFFEITEGEETLAIYSIDIDDSGDVYIGTSKGVYSADLGTKGDASGIPVNPSLIPGTAGYGFTKVSVNGTYAAFLSSYDLFIYNTDTGSLTSYPFYSGLPGMLTGLSWQGNVLFISGTGVDAEGNAVPLGKGGMVSLTIE